MTTEEKYLKNPNACPYCNSENITAGHITAEDSTAYRDVKCTACNTTWTEEFTLTGITEE